MTMRRQFLVMITIFMLGGGVLTAQDTPELSTQQEVLDFCSKVMGNLQTYNYDIAFDLLYRTAVPQMKEGIINLKLETRKQIDQITPDFGSIVGYKLLDFENKEDVLLGVKYLLQFEYHALRWELLFYKPKNFWVLDNIFWDDSLTELFN